MKMFVVNITLFLHRQSLFLCLILGLLYIFVTYLFLRSDPLFNKINESSNVTNISTSKDKKGLKVTTFPTPLQYYSKLSHLSNETKLRVDKYDSIKLYFELQKRRVARYSRRKITPAPVTLEESRTNDSVHMFFVDKNNFLPKNKTRAQKFNIIHENFKLAKKSGAGVLIFKYSQLYDEIENMPHFSNSIMNYASDYKINVTIAIGDHFNRNVMRVLKNINDFFDKFSELEHVYKYRKNENSPLLPVIYMIGSYNIEPMEWFEVLSPKGKYTLRGTSNDVIILGELKDESHKSHIRISNFDGFFTSHLMNSESYASTWKNWNSLSAWANDKRLLWSAGINEACKHEMVGVGLRTALKSTPRPTFVSFSNVPSLDDYLSYSQIWIQRWSNSSVDLY